MSIITFPDDIWVTRMRWEQMRMDLTHTSPQAGVTQAVTYGSPRWTVSLEIDRSREASAGSAKALLMQLRGQINQLALWDIARPTPLGTISGSATLSGNHLVGATTISLSGVSGTVKKGDWLGVGSGQTRQLVMVVADSNANSVTIEPPLRFSQSSGTSVVYNKPTALFRLSTARQGWDSSGIYLENLTLDLIEDWEVV
jgi:hypothetical protein